MVVTIRLLASFRRYLPADHDAQASYRHEVRPGTRVADLLPEIPIPHDEAYTFMVNGRHATRDLVLHEGDTLALFPAVGGGG